MNEEFAISLKTILDDSSIAQVKKKLEDLKESVQTGVQNATAPATTATNHFDITGAKEYTAQIRLLQIQIDSVTEDLQAMYELNARHPNDNLTWSDEAIAKAEAELEKLKNKMIQLQTAGNKIPKNMEETEEEAEETVSVFSFFKESVSKTKVEMQGLFKGALKLGAAVLGVAGVYGSIRKAMSTYLAQNTELQNKINACWYALGSLFAPVLEWIVNLFVKAVSLINALVKALGFAGINMTKYGKAAGKAQKQLAGFDEINNLSEQGGGASNPFGNFDLSDKFKDFAALIQGNIDLLKLMGLGAMFGIGVALLFTGHPAAGLGMILAAGVLTYSYVNENWDYIVSKVGGTKNAILALLTGFAFGLGVILLLSGNLIGLGLIAGSIAVATTMMDWNYLPKEAAKTVSKILKIVGAATAAIGMIALIVGFASGNPGLAIAGLLMMFGGAGISVGSDNVYNSNALADTIESELEAVEGVVNDDMPKIDRAFENGWGGVELDAQNSMRSIYGTVDGNMGSVGRSFGQYLLGMQNTNRITWSDVGKYISDAWSGIKTKVSKDWDDIKSAASTKFGNIKSTISGAWDTVKSNTSTAWNNITNSIGTQLSNIGSKIANSGIAQKVKSLFNIEPVIKPVVKMPKIQSQTQNGNVFWSNVGTWTSQAYARGTDFVPNDQIALLHKGEAVIPAEYNDGIQGSPYMGGSETNNLLRELIDIVDTKEFRAYISQNEIGKTAVKYINNQSRIQGGSIV